MPLHPSDFRLTAEQRLRAANLLQHWDARDPWVDNARLERELLDLLERVTAPRVVALQSAVHAAKFLREILERPEP